MSRDDGIYDFERRVNQELFYYILGQHYEFIEETHKPIDNETFYMQMYNWNDEEDSKPNFYHKPSGLKLWWYKYPLRATMSNMKITSEQFAEVLWDCRNSLQKGSLKFIHVTNDWWRKEK